VGRGKAVLVQAYFIAFITEAEENHNTSPTTAAASTKIRRHRLHKCVNFTAFLSDAVKTQRQWKNLASIKELGLDYNVKFPYSKFKMGIEMLLFIRTFTPAVGFVTSPNSVFLN
jgi:hypothetical protein